MFLYLPSTELEFDSKYPNSFYAVVKYLIEFQSSRSFILIFQTCKLAREYLMVLIRIFFAQMLEATMSEIKIAVLNFIIFESNINF